MYHPRRPRQLAKGERNKKKIIVAFAKISESRVPPAFQWRGEKARLLSVSLLPAKSEVAQKSKQLALSLTRVHHRNLVSLLGYCDEENNLALVYEYMSQGSLADHLRVVKDHCPIDVKTQRVQGSNPGCVPPHPSACPLMGFKNN
ncbi:hypothetical protein Taro_047741 [Colocasia esculenta]|uniref:Serine-threonine/tyrosine-protein kinase catalytic domain-containing protein n=1 Tax=Colocasia esculenta TaxID=4460 RepID=A0A843X1K1_COLES|nr:hypothetical protein [Colocasia esculenta]